MTEVGPAPHINASTETSTSFSQAVDSPSDKNRIPNWLKTSMVIAISVAILYYYFKDIDRTALLTSIREANLWLAISALIVAQLSFWIFDVITTERHFAWYHGPFSWREYFWVRGAFYLLMMLNTSLGQGGIFLYLQQNTKMPWIKYSGLIFFRSALQLGVIAVLIIPISFALHYFNIFEASKLNPYLWWGIILGGSVALLDGYLFFVKKTTIGLSRWVVWNREHDFWLCFNQSTTMQWIWTMVWGAIPTIVMVICFWFYAIAFNVHVPFILFSVTFLLVIMISDAPISFAGFGTTTMAWMLFYQDYGSIEAIASLSLFQPFARTAIRAVIGLISIKPAMSLINLSKVN